MKEMRLFEVGLKEEAHRSVYEEKVNVAANDAEEAVTKARQWVMDNTIRWWEGDGREEMIFAAYADDKKAAAEMTEDEILKEKMYQEAAQKEYETLIERNKNLFLAKVLDIGTLIV